MKGKFNSSPMAVPITEWIAEEFAVKTRVIMLPSARNRNFPIRHQTVPTKRFAAR